MKKVASIELLRFISAIMVLIWHYQQFYLPINLFSDNEILVSSRDQQPFYDYLSFFFNYGNKGVDFFFIISGYVFAYVYLVENKITSLKFFFINRFARLYPLHFLTLIVVLILQLYSYNNFNNYVIHLFNDIYHFILNIFFISAWGFEKGLSFNGPIWSVSIEIIIYILFFFLILKTNNNRYLKSLLLIFIFIILQKILENNIFEYLNMNIINCGILFFEGVFIHFIVKKIKNNNLIILGIILFIASLIGNFKIYIFLPSILVMFLYFDIFLGKKLRQLFSFLGNLTYGTYLWHLPVQISLIIFMEIFKLSYSLIDTKLFFILYISAVILLSVISYYLFENRMRKIIRKRFNSK